MYQVTSAAKQLEAPATTEKELFERLSVYTNSVIRVEHNNSRYWMDVITTGVLGSVQLRSSREAYDNEDSLHFRIGNEDWVDLSIESKISVLLDGAWKIIHEDLPKDEDEEEENEKLAVVFDRTTFDDEYEDYED